MAKQATSIASRFWPKVAVRGTDECWLWTGSLTTSGGYGQIARTRAEGPARANRISWEMANGRPVPEGLIVLHDCDTPACVNPAHLRLGTQDENCKDMSRKGRWKNHCSKGQNHVPFNSHLK